MQPLDMSPVAKFMYWFIFFLLVWTVALYTYKQKQRAKAKESQGDQNKQQNENEEENPYAETVERLLDPAVNTSTARDEEVGRL